MRKTINRKKGVFLIFRYNHLFEKVNLFRIPDFGVKVVPLIYAIGGKSFFKKAFVLEKTLLPSLNTTFKQQLISGITNLTVSLLFASCIDSVKIE